MNNTISKGENILLWSIRIIVGVLFILSGYSKLIDPHGLEYKMEEFLQVLHWDIFVPHALLFSICMIAFEILAGFALLIGYRFKLFSFLLLLLSLFFTFLTAFALFAKDANGNHLIKECGCFGGCVKLTNNETFWKDVVLSILIIYLVFRRSFVKSIFGNKLGFFLTLLAAIAAFGVQYWVLIHGPLVDCLPYKVGSNIPDRMKKQPGCIEDSVSYEFIYEKNGAKKSFDMAHLTEIDSTWKYIDRKEVLVKEGNCEVDIRDFRINDSSSNNITPEILASSKPTMLVIIKDVKAAYGDNVQKLKLLTDKCMASGINVIGATATSDAEEIADFKNKFGLGFIFNTLDGTVCKTAIRANSGLIVIKNGTVTYKCTYADYPTYNKIPQ